MKDFSKVRYLKFSANDPHEAEFYNVIIDLTTDKIISGVIKVGEEGEDRETVIINGRNKYGSLTNPEYSIFAKVTDSGSYYLLDEKGIAIYESHGYVPHLMEYYNENPSGGDCIEILIEDMETGKLAHMMDPKINYNREEDWTEIKKIKI